MPVVTGTGFGTGRLRQVGAGVGLAALLFAATACATPNETNAASAVQLSSKTTASSAGSTGSTGSTGSASSQAERTKQAKEFTACMRSNGVSDFPGITILADGTVKLDLTGESVNPISATYKKAAKTCSDLLPAGSSLPGDPTPPTLSEPALNFSCSGDYCPSAPKAPELPS